MTMNKQRNCYEERRRGGSAALRAFGRCGPQYAVQGGQGGQGGQGAVAAMAGGSARGDGTQPNGDFEGEGKTDKVHKTNKIRRTRDVLLAHRWLWAARARDPQATLMVRRGWMGPWRACAPVLRVPELPARVSSHGEALTLLATVPGPALRSRARLRAACLLACAGVDAAAARELLRRYEGFFPGVEVGVAWSLHRRMCERGRSCLRCLDLRSLTLDLVAGAGVWTLPEAGGGRWPVGVHLFATGMQAAEPAGRWNRAGTRGRSIPHAAPR